MLDQAHLRLARIFACAGDWPALRTLFGIVQRGVVARQTERCRSHADGNARFVHHVEHAFEAFAGFANQVTHCASLAIGFEFALTEIQQGIWRARPTQFVVQACKRHIVALPGHFAMRVDHFFRHDEQGNPSRPRYELAGFIGNFCQHQMNDVFRHIMLAARNPHLVATQAVARTQSVARILQLGACRDIRQRRTRLRLRQAHRASPAAIELVGRKHPLLHR